LVLERLFPEDWLEKKFKYAFLLGLGYSVIGIIIARLLFPSNSGIVSVIFTSIFLSPSMRKIFLIEETSEEKEKKFSFKRLIRSDYDVILMYFLVFIGIFTSYLAFSFLLPQLGLNTFDILKEQLFLDPALRGHATFSFYSFQFIFYNNWWVLLATFILALIAGDGAIFFVTWNASAWGAIFGSRVINASIYSGQNPWYLLLIVLSLVIWHLLLEGGAYILAGIAGSTISNEIIKERIEIAEFVVWVIAGSALFVLVNYVIKPMGFTPLITLIFYFLLTLILLYFLGKIVAEKKNKVVFIYNFAVFVAAIVVFILGATVETIAVSNFHILAEVDIMSYCAANNFSLQECVRFMPFYNT